MKYTFKRDVQTAKSHRKSQSNKQMSETDAGATG